MSRPRLSVRRYNNDSVWFRRSHLPSQMPRYLLWSGDVVEFMNKLPARRQINLAITSPPYNIGKLYEDRMDREEYVQWQAMIIDLIVARLAPGGSVCWQVGNYVNNGSIEPLDILLHDVFVSRGMKLRNRIIWRFGHGLHCRNRFSGRYETVMWYTRDDNYTFNLDAVRIPSKYPGKKAYRGPSAGEYSSNPLGKNPEDVWEFPSDVWELPNVKANHIEKTIHPCQFPVGLAERVILALTNKRDLVFDPFCGVGSAGVAAAVHARDFWGCEIKSDYCELSRKRINAALRGLSRYRPHDKPVFDHRNSPLSRAPDRRN